VFKKSIRIYYEDAGGVVYVSDYLNFMELCRCDWRDSLGFNIANIEENEGLLLLCAKQHSSMTYRQGCLTN
jgi:YbgC/YbaW family acyl-CoA thioester hydrolase